MGTPSLKKKVTTHISSQSALYNFLKRFLFHHRFHLMIDLILELRTVERCVTYSNLFWNIIERTVPSHSIRYKHSIYSYFFQGPTRILKRGRPEMQISLRRSGHHPEKLCIPRAIYNTQCLPTRFCSAFREREKKCRTISFTCSSLFVFLTTPCELHDRQDWSHDRREIPMQRYPRCTMRSVLTDSRTPFLNAKARNDPWDLESNGV